jgi:hypothetical protein
MSISYSDTAPATVGKNVGLYDHCAQMRHGKVIQQSNQSLTYKSGDRPVALQTNRGVRYCADRQSLSVFSPVCTSVKIK